MRALYFALPGLLLAAGCAAPVSQPVQQQPQAQTGYEQRRLRDDQRQRELAEERRREQQFQAETEAQKEERLHRQRMEEQRERNRHRENMGRRTPSRTTRSGDEDCIGTRRWRTRTTGLELALQNGDRSLCQKSRLVERLLERERELGCKIPNQGFIEDLITDSQCLE